MNCRTLSQPYGQKHELGTLFGDFDTLFRDFKGWEPVRDFVSREDDDQYVVRYELPGLKKDELSVRASNGVVRIAGSKRVWGEDTDASVKVERAFSLPSKADVDKISAHYEDGLLTVTLPKREEAKPREIEIKVQ